MADDYNPQFPPGYMPQFPEDEGDPIDPGELEAETSPRRWGTFRFVGWRFNK